VSKFLWADCWTNGKAVSPATVSGKREEIEDLHAQSEKGGE
jgi:hypothetical protein